MLRTTRLLACAALLASSLAACAVGEDPRADVLVPADVARVDAVQPDTVTQPDVPTGVDRVTPADRAMPPADVPVAMDAPVGADVPVAMDVPVATDVPVVMDVPVAMDVVTDPCAAVDCSPLRDACHGAVCMGGICVRSPLPDTTTCDDGNRCTTGDHCVAGTCTAGAPVDCSAMNSACATGTCSAATGACTTTPRADGTGCDTDPTDCVAQACRAGVCAAGPALDCSACGMGATQVCSAGTCGAGPATLSYDFEAGLPGGWTTGGNTPFTSSTARAHGGTHAAVSGAIGDSQRSSMSAAVNFPRAATVSFWVFTSTESCCDHLQYFVDGTMVSQWQGTTAWTQVSFPLAAGMHTLEWRYQKDGSVASGSDQVAVDDVLITPTPPTVTLSTDDFEAGTTLPAGYTTSGSPGWAVSSVATDAHAGSRSARAGTIGDGGTTGLVRSVTLTGAGAVSFWYRVSSESGYDYLHFFVDGTMQQQWSGTVAWASATFPLTAGTHSLEWRYTKDGSLASGSDTAWVDDVVITGPGMPSGVLCP